MAIPKVLRMGPAEYITTSGMRLGNGGAATVIGPDMADIILDSCLSETGQQHVLFQELLDVVVERLRMFNVVKRPIPRPQLDAIASGLLAILAVNGLYRAISREAAVRFFKLGPEPPPRLRWSTIDEYDEVERRREEKKTSGRRRRGGRGGQKPRLSLVKARANARAS